MGLSDIDEDEPPVVQRPSAPPASTPIVLQPVAQAAPAPATSNTAKKGFDLDDLFGGMGVSGGATGSGAPAPAPVPVATAATAESAPVPSNDVLDSLFATASPLAPCGVASASPTGSTNSFGVQSKPSGGSMLYVGDEDAGAADDGTNLFDTSKPVEKQTFSTAESLLEAFARQGKKGGPSRFDAKDSLDHLTKNKDDNKVRARLLALMDYYDVLGVAHTASEEEIKRSYRKKALELHPDRVGRDQTPEEAELFKTITKANEVLTDPEKRAEYDRQLRSGGGGFAPAGAAGAGADWFSHLQPPQ